MPKEEAAQAHLALFQEEQGQNVTRIYRDASVLLSGTGVGVGLAAYYQGQIIHQAELNLEED
jgi:hypothetical protein